MAAERQPSGATDEAAGVNDRANNAARGPASSRRIETKTKITTTTTKTDEIKRQELDGQVSAGVATVEHLGRQANTTESDRRTGQQTSRKSEPGAERVVDTDWLEWEPARPVELGQVNAEGNKLVTSVGTVAVRSGQSRIVAALLRDGCELQLRVQEMRPGVFEVGANLNECRKFLAEHQKLLASLARHKQAPIEAWLAKYKRANQTRADMSDELRLVYMCMAENLQACWRGLLLQLEQRLQLLDETAKFYASAELLFKAIERADGHVQTFRREFLEGLGSVRFSQAANELRRLNGAVLEEFVGAKRQQKRLTELVAKVATGNLADSRANLLIGDAQNLIEFINNYMEPLERRKVQLENVISSTTRGNNTNTKTTTTKTSTRTLQADNPNQQEGRAPKPPGPPSVAFIREIGSFNDLHLAEGWLAAKLDQLNSSLLSSLGSSAQDTRSILNKHEQIALECSAIEEALLTFRGKSIHAMPRQQQAPAGEEQQVASSNNDGQQEPAGQAGLLEQQRQLAAKARDVITVLDARVALLRRTIEFYARAKEATADINKMMRRLQADNSLQSVQFVKDELELKDVSSVVASGATIISELQQLQLAQQHGQRSKAVGLQLATGGIRAVIDQLNQELAHLKTVLNQRRLVLLNEDASKMAQNFSSKCRQLKFWLDNQARSFLLSNNRVGVEVRAARAFCEQHDELRLAVQQKTLEVEALLRLLSNLTESFDAKSHTADEIQRDTDELRQDWISVTNCLEQRLELARKYLAILVGVAELRADIEALGGAQDDAGARPMTPDERTHEDMEAHVGQALVQLAQQVRNFTQDAQRSNTALVYSAALEAKAAVNDLNKQQIVGHANGSVRLLEEQLKATLNRLKARGPRKWPADEAGQRTAPRRRTERALATPTAEQQQAGAGLPQAPRFVRQLADAEVEPFSSVALECELEPDRQPVRVDWLLNTKRIPSNIKHSLASDGNRHRLTINQFSPVCCGTYSARATNQLGVSSVSSCRLRLSGIREDESPKPSGQPAAAASSAEPDARAQGSRAHHQEAPVRPSGQWRQDANTNRWQQQVSKERALERIIQGVESPMSHDEQPNEPSSSSAGPTRAASNQQTEAATITTRTTTATNTSQLPVTRLSYDGNQLLAAKQHRISYIDSPSSSAQSRSVSRSPFEGTPQPPVFMQALSEQLPATNGSSSQAGLVCVVIGNPPPNVEWLHEGRPIARAKCPRPTATGQRANVCKLTIETVNERTLGQYVCRATNRLGQSTTAIRLGQ